jgi:hypothetical protein
MKTWKNCCILNVCSKNGVKTNVNGVNKGDEFKKIVITPKKWISFGK